MGNHEPIGYHIKFIDNQILFKDIDIGRAFIYDGRLYMKTDPSHSRKTNSVGFGLNDAGTLHHFTDHLMVIPLNAYIRAETI